MANTSDLTTCLHFIGPTLPSGDPDAGLGNVSAGTAFDAEWIVGNPAHASVPAAVWLAIGDTAIVQDASRALEGAMARLTGVSSETAGDTASPPMEDADPPAVDTAPTLMPSTNEADVTAMVQHSVASTHEAAAGAERASQSHTSPSLHRLSLASSMGMSAGSVDAYSLATDDGAAPVDLGRQQQNPAQVQTTQNTPNASWSPSPSVQASEADSGSLRLKDQLSPLPTVPQNAAQLPGPDRSGQPQVAPATIPAATAANPIGSDFDATQLSPRDQRERQPANLSRMTPPPQTGAVVSSATPIVAQLSNLAFAQPAAPGTLFRPQITEMSVESWRRDLADMPLTAGDSSGATRLGAPAATPPGTQNMPAISRQIAASVATMGDGAVEITLAPEELGRLRIRVTHHDGAAIVSLSFDRPDIADSARRHAAMLLQDLHDSGLPDAQLDFRDRQDAQGRDTRDPRDLETGGSEAEDSLRPLRGTIVAALAQRQVPGAGRHLDMLM